MRFISNLSSSSVFPCVPWEWNLPAPGYAAGPNSKADRHTWITNPATSWQCYSLWEGLNECLRISEDKGAVEGNPPFRCHGLVGDYDAPVGDEELLAGLGRLNPLHLPSYFERTLSGNVRLVWLFEQPVTVPSRSFAIAFLEYAITQIKFDNVCAGLDRPAFLEPNRYWTNSGVWAQISDVRVPANWVQGWVVEVARRFRWEKHDVVIPLPIVWQELQKRYPHHGWEGEFAEEAMGPSFFIEGSVSPKSAIVKATGFFSFSAHAAKPFWSWADLLGKDFVSQYETSAMGAAVEGIYHDGQKYFSKDGTGSWRPYSKEDIRDHIVITRGLSGARQQGQPSLADRALEYIRHWQGIDGAAPFAFKKYGIYTGAGPRFLNTHTRRVLTPVDEGAEGAEWGPTGKFPWLSAFFDHLLVDQTQLESFLSWLHRFYSSAFELDIERGQNVFLIGPAGTGKTLLAQNILAKLMGGAAEAQEYLLGDTAFNSQLFEVALWTVDDNKAVTSATAHATFSSMVKKLAANQTFEYHAKFRVPCTVVWQGRVVVTANDDGESLRIIPDLSLSNKDKTMLYKVCKEPIEFPSSREIEDTLRRELPFFARWLLGWEIPVSCQGTSRYGVAAYHDPELLQQAEFASRTNSFVEVLHDWHSTYFSEHPKAEAWEGTAFQLLKRFQNDESSRSAVNLKPDQITRQLQLLLAKGYNLSVSHISGVDLIQKWRIERVLSHHTPSEKHV